MPRIVTLSASATEIVCALGLEGDLVGVSHECDFPPAVKVNTKPFGEWNAMTITCKGRKVKVEQNGETLVDANLDDYKEHVKRHPGLERTKGHIGFQSYNFRVEFRNVFIKPL